jgi:hypothetical protein
VAKQDIAAGRRKLFGITQEIMHHDVGRLERRQLLEETADITLRIIITDTAVEDLHGFTARVQHSLEARLDRVFLFKRPSRV